MVVVSGLWKDRTGSATYGYCSCGREVKYSKEYIDEKCPMCGAKLEWKTNDKSLWIHGRNCK